MITIERRNEMCMRGFNDKREGRNFAQTSQHTHAEHDAYCVGWMAAAAGRRKPDLWAYKNGHLVYAESQQ